MEEGTAVAPGLGNQFSGDYGLDQHYLLDESEEKSEQGIVVSVKEDFAFVRCPQRANPLLFRVGDFISETEGPITQLTGSLTPGDEVSFRLGAIIDGQQTVTEVRKVSAIESIVARLGQGGVSVGEQSYVDQDPDGEYREHGIVNRLKDTNGFISRPRPYLGRLFFHFKYVRSDESGGPTKLEIGSEVSYIVCREGNRMFAADVVVLKAGTITQESKVEGTFKGRIIRPAVAPAPEDNREDGIIGYFDGDTDQRAFYGHHNVDDQAVPLDERDEVEFEIFRQVYRKEARAVKVKLLEKAPEKTENGKISIMKSSFGFIKCCERHNDVLFHFSDLDGVESSELEIGDDVKFSVKWDMEKGKQIATKVMRGVSGSAVFETVSEDVHYGIVVERLGLWKQFTNNGVVLFEGEGGVSEKLTFSANDLEDRQLNPQVGDKVSFKVAINLAQAKAAERLDGPAGKFGGRRATGVSLVKYIGRVASLVSNGSYGFIDYEHERGMSHIFFHCSEVDKTSQLRVNDIVQFVRVYNPNKQQHQARRVHKISDGQLNAQMASSGNAQGAVGAVEPASAPEPEVVGKKKPGMNRTAKGPEGGRGFPFGRGRPIAVPELQPTKSANLNPSAAPFVPRSLSIQSVGS
ncbi:hypothetical protein BSKO_03192 [Bryopsis sp. KO-2023]|nr:hypothetical protein BSKO_03192 [Bryopsis sp. KO-2023]